MDGRTWQKAKVPPYKHAIVPYGATMVSLPSQIAYGGWQKICHIIQPWRLFNNTGLHFATLQD